MGLLQVNPDGVKLENGESEFLLPIYAEEIHSREVRQSGKHTFLAPIPTFFSSFPPSALFKARSQTTVCSIKWPDTSLFTKLGCEQLDPWTHMLLSSQSYSLLILGQFLHSCSERTVFFWLYFFLGDVSEQTGFGSHSRCTWWCSELPINLRDIRGGK